MFNFFMERLGEDPSSEGCDEAKLPGGVRELAGDFGRGQDFEDFYRNEFQDKKAGEAALLWIDRIRKVGMDSSFIHHQEPDKILFEKLSEMIEQI